MDTEKVYTLDEKKTWTAPRLIVYGSVEEITGDCLPPGCKAKKLGTGDDLTTSISNC
jgi:hypothetical protein